MLMTTIWPIKNTLLMYLVENFYNLLQCVISNLVHDWPQCKCM